MERRTFLLALIALPAWLRRSRTGCTEGPVIPVADHRPPSVPDRNKVGLWYAEETCWGAHPGDLVNYELRC